MYTDGTLGYMLQGVSQQPERVQPEGHVREQINMVSDPNTGLSTRAGSELIVVTDDIPATARHRTTTFSDFAVRISSDDNYVGAVDYNGNVYTVADPDAYIGYFGKNMAYYAQDDLIYCVNRETVVETVAGSATFVEQWGFIQALGAEFSKTYVATLSYSDGTVVTASHTTPDADAAGAAGATTAANVAEGLRAGLAGVKKASTTIARKDEVVYLRDDTVSFTLSVYDAANNTVVRAGSGAQGVGTFADIPKFSSQNAVIKVRGEQGTVNDDVWLKYDISDAIATGGGFGRAGVWRETSDPAQNEVFDLSTMPHALQIDGLTMTIIRPEWEGRRVGNDEINPTPSFVGRKIRDIVSFQGRLAVIAGPYAIMSRTDNNLDFYRRTATTVLPTDPIDIRTAGEDDSFMEWLIPYDNNLIVAAKDGQFFISGINSLTSSNAAMPRSSSFEMSTIAKPVVSGQTVMLPYNARAFSGVNEMLPTEEGAANTIESINNVTRKYIRGEIIGMTASANANFLGVHTDTETHTIYVYNFLWENNSKAQAAWHKWVFPDPIQHVYTQNNTVFVWTSRGTQTWLTAIKLDKPIEESTGYHITGDFLIDVDTTVAITLPREDYNFVALGDGEVYASGRRITPLSVVADGPDWTYTLPSGVPDTVVAGVPIPVELRPNRPFAKDWRGNPKFNDTLIVQKFLIDYEESGALTALMDSIWRSEDGELIEIVNNRIIPAADDPRDSFQTAVRTGTLEVPWNENAKDAQLVVKTETLAPINIVEIRWFGQVYKGRS